MKIKSICTKGMSILLSTMMVASMMPVQVFAYDPTSPVNEFINEGGQYGDDVQPGDTSKPVYVGEWKEEGVGEDITVEGGNITCDTSTIEGDYEDMPALEVESYDGLTATVTTGSVTNTAESGDGVVAYAGDDEAPGGNAVLRINGDVTATYDGIYVDSEYGGSADVNVTGNVSAIGDNADDGVAFYTYDGTSNVFIGGDVSADDGIYGDTDYGTTNVNVNGSINAASYGINAWSYNGGNTKITVGKDVNAGSIGVYSCTSDGGVVDIRVEGTIKGDDLGVEVSSNAEYKDKITITAWAITPNDDGIVAGCWEDDQQKYVQDKDFEEKNIFYIIKLEQPAEGATLSAVDKANEGDEVKLTVDLQDGYDITGAFNGLGEKVPLEMGADGKYYVVVPKGGGVYLSVTVGKKTKILNPQPTNGDSSSNNTENGATLCASIAQMIMNAAPGATVTANILSGLSLCKAVVDALEARPDVTLIVNYAYNNGIYSATIPPRTSDLTQYKNAAGGIDFEILTTNFNGKQIY